MTATTFDRLLGGRVLLEQPVAGLRAAIDAVLLAAAVPARTGDAVLELGCGTGVGLLCLAARVPGLALHGVELDPVLVALAQSNVTRAGLHAAILQGDMRQPVPPVDHAFANPPYWPGGTASPIGLRRDAAHEGSARLADWVAALVAPVRRRGSVSLILPAARLSEALAALRGAGCGSIAVVPLWPRAGQPARRVILRGIRGGRGPDRLLAGLVLHVGGGFTPAADTVLRDGHALIF